MPRLTAGTTLVARYEVKELETTPHMDVEQWLAEDKIFGRDVNLYVLDSSVPAGALDRARKCAQLSVEHVARVIDVIDKGVDQRFVVTERPRGISTAAAIANSTFNMRQTKAAIGSIAQALVKAKETKNLRHGAITSDSIYFHNTTATLTGLVPRNFLGLNLPLSDDVLAENDTKGLAALAYFMLTGLMSNYQSDDASELPRLKGFLTDPDPDVDVYTTNILNNAPGAITNPQDFLEALGEWSEDDLPMVKEPEPTAPVEEKASESPAPPVRTSARSSSSAKSPLPSSQPPAAIALSATSVPSNGSAAAAASTAASGASNATTHIGASDGDATDSSQSNDVTELSSVPHSSSADPSDALNAGGPPRFLPSTSDKQFSQQNRVNVPSPVQQDAPVWTVPPAGARNSGGFNPTPFVLSFFGIVIVLGLIWAIKGLTAPTEPMVVSPTGRPTATAEDAEGDSKEGAKTKPSKTPEVVLPVIKSATSVDPDGDQNEHPELQDKLIDGDATSPWFSRTYKTANFGGIKKDGIGAVIGLEKKATVTSVLVSSANKGGKFEIRTGSVKDPKGGKVLAKGSFDGETVVKLDKPVEAKSIVLWVTELPTDQNGDFRVYLYEIGLT